MLDEVKRAMETVRRGTQEAKEPRPVWSSDIADFYTAVATLAKAYLVEHPADEDEPANSEWVDSLHGPDLGHTLFTRLGDFFRDTTKLTRGDVRRLCRALGIELREQT